ncbi:hypothetical protein [Biformimicrobium ophioploci]|uniref:DUF4156 domain-containing protein n=1 Tax=Biformimicrobium ophioploci TaxID=3036711 RepID=A0ABQ6M2N1_9GAMM|nr:hypothetical protein [Microbulbifer sp. NKW57]GMG88600.1 hypothetical protein MNKW57_29210 [Microbulbifer sp. NKW57]
MMKYCAVIATVTLLQACAMNGDKPIRADRELLVCHNGSTIEIRDENVDAYLAKGAYRGRCESDPQEMKAAAAREVGHLTICHQGETMNVAYDKAEELLAQGADRGACVGNGF